MDKHFTHIQSFEIFFQFLEQQLKGAFYDLLPGPSIWIIFKV